MRKNVKKEIFLLLALAIAILIIPTAAVSDAAPGDGSILFKNNFGGVGRDSYNKIVAVSDGFIAAGYSEEKSFGNGNWMGTKGKGAIDAILIKYDTGGEVIWKKNFGGSGSDFFLSMTEVSDGYVAVGYSTRLSFGNGDWEDFENRGGEDSVIVKYDRDGTVVWQKNFGGSSTDHFESVTTVFDGIIAVGFSESSSFGNGDWTGVNGRAGLNSTIVKFDNDGNVIWKKTFGGGGNDYFESVTTVSDGVVAVGYSESISFGNGDWSNVQGKGGYDGVAVKYNNVGDVIWAKNHGGAGNDYFRSVTAVSDGVVMAGYSLASSFGTGDWSGIEGKGNEDATIVKLSNAGEIMWSNNFGGSGVDRYYAVISVSGGFVAAGYSHMNSFGNGDWTDTEGKGSEDAIAVKHDKNGNVTWKNSFGGTDADNFLSIAAELGNVVAAGFSGQGSFGTGDWPSPTFTRRGSDDAIIVIYDLNVFIPVLNIVNVPQRAIVGKDVVLTGTVSPSDATNWLITWKVKNPGETGATITISPTGTAVLSTTSTGVVIVTATVEGGVSPGTAFTKDIFIDVVSPDSNDRLIWAGVAAVLAVIVIAGAAIYFRCRNDTQCK